MIAFEWTKIMKMKLNTLIFWVTFTLIFNRSLRSILVIMQLKLQDCLVAKPSKNWYLWTIKFNQTWNNYVVQKSKRKKIYFEIHILEFQNYFVFSGNKFPLFVNWIRKFGIVVDLPVLFILTLVRAREHDSRNLSVDQ